MTQTSHEALAIIASEWFRCSRRALRLAAEAAPARLERERAQHAYATQRVQDALTTHGLRLHDFSGSAYSPSLPVEPLNPEDFDTEEGLVVTETVEPTVLLDGKVLLRGKVVLGRGA
jgi:hypothetical protein